MEYPDFHPKFNRYSVHVQENCSGKLLDHQCTALRHLQQWFDRDDPRIGLVSMPTGSGKTGVMCCLPYFLGSIGLQPSRDRNNYPTGNPLHVFDKPVLVIAPNLEIANQLEGQILQSADELNENFLLKRKIVPEKNKRDVLPVGVKIEGTAQLTFPRFLSGKDVVISNAQKFLSEKQLQKTNEESRWWVEELPEDLFRLVIVDEAHHFPAPTWHRIIQKFRGHALVVFFTATPYRSDRKSLVDDYFVYRLSLLEARQRGIIRRTKWNPVDTEHTNDEVIFRLVLEGVKVIQNRKNAKDRLPNNHPHMAIAITKNKELADLAVDIWNEDRDIESAIAYHSGVKSELPQMMKRVRGDKVKLLVVVGMLLEGFDHPPISIAAILTNIKSTLKFVQFVGRAQRIVRGSAGDKEDPNICADIVTHSRYQQEENYHKFDNEELYDDNNYI